MPFVPVDLRLVDFYRNGTVSDDFGPFLFHRFCGQLWAALLSFNGMSCHLSIAKFTAIMPLITSKTSHNFTDYRVSL
jgi:hypothetical protein